MLANIYGLWFSHDFNFTISNLFYIRSTITPPMTNLLLFGFQMTRNTDYTPGIHHQQSTERRHQLALSWAVRSMSRSTEKYIWPGAACACDFSSCQLECTELSVVALGVLISYRMEVYSNFSRAILKWCGLGGQTSNNIIVAITVWELWCSLHAHKTVKNVWGNVQCGKRGGFRGNNGPASS